jgi:hypothetical protein
MILIISHKEDFTADFLIDRLNKSGIEYFRLNCDDLAEISHLYSSSNGFISEVEKFKKFTSVWYRRTKLPNISQKGMSIAEWANVLNEYEALLDNLLHSIDCDTWLSHPDAIKIAENKLFQLRKANDLGFNIPDVLVTNSKEELLKFEALHGQLVIKPLKNGRVREDGYDKLIYTNRLRKEHLENIENFDLTPCIFQREIKKQYELRVTVVGDVAFAARVDSQNDPETMVDWRKKKLKFTRYELPDNLHKKFLLLTKSMNLSFGAIDLIKSTDDKYYFLEINPNGQWAWVERDTDQPISDHVIHFLQNA